MSIMIRQEMSIDGIRWLDLFYSAIFISFSALTIWWFENWIPKHATMACMEVRFGALPFSPEDLSVFSIKQWVRQSVLAVESQSREKAEVRIGVNSKQETC